MSGNLQGPCPDCGGMFPDLKAHYDQAHRNQTTVTSQPSHTPVGGVCKWCQKWTDDMKSHLEWHESQGVLHKFWNKPRW